MRLAVWHFALMGALMFSTSVVAQEPRPASQGLLPGSQGQKNLPVQIDAKALEVQDKKKTATFTGNVKVVQGDTTMTSTSLVVFYEDKPAQPPAGAKAAKGSAAPAMQAAAPGPGGASSIKRLEAKGNVVVTQKDQVVTGEAAIFDTKTNLITMVGGVVLTQCQNVLRGDRLLVDMTTGVSRVEADNGKVQGLFVQTKKGEAPKPGCGSPIAPAAAPPPPAKPK
jgi:lipopolysaccharide export system protein LptA